MSQNSSQYKQAKLNQDNSKLGISLKNVTLDGLTGGQMVDIQRLKQKKLKEFKINIGTAYIPLEQQDIPERLFVPDKPSDVLRQKLEQLNKYVDEEKDLFQKYKKKLGKERELEQDENDRFRQSREQKEDIPNKDASNKQNKINLPENLAQSEMGIQSDGQAINSGAHQGLGYNERRQGSNDEMFDRFRQKQSQNYHQNAEERSFSREKVETCYKCSLPGHIARDCKYGLT